MSRWGTSVGAEELPRRGPGERAIRGILGENGVRVYRDVWS
jgi:microsomal dipeptidase-like Zn-dependent dipeptidase